MKYTLRKINKHVGAEWGKHLGRPECPYLRRWSLKAGLFSVRVHHFYRSDDERAFHDHPWPFVTLVLKGGYTDVSPCLGCDGNGRLGGHWSHTTCYRCEGTGEQQDHLTPGHVRRRSAFHKHTVRTDPGGVWTIILTGPNLRTWGFWEPRPDGTTKFRKANKWFKLRGHHPCDQP